MIKFLDCKSGFEKFKFYKFKNSTYESIILRFIAHSRIDGFPIFEIYYRDNVNFPIQNYNFGFRFSKIEPIINLEDNTNFNQFNESRSKKDELYDLMCSILDIENNCYLDERKYGRALRTLKIDNLLGKSTDINDIV